MVDCKQSELGTDGGSYAVILLVSPLGSLTIAIFYSSSVHCFVVAHFFLLLNIYHIVHILLHVDNLRKRYNFTEV